jgi:hypothetical protein
VGIAQEAHCPQDSSTPSFQALAQSTVTNFQAGPLILAGHLPGDGNTGTDGNLIIQSANAVPGGVASIDIDADENISSIAGLNITVQFDPSLQVSDADVEAGPLLVSPIMQINTTTPGQVTLAVASDRTSKGPGRLARLVFHIPPTAVLGANYPIYLAKLEANDSNRLLDLGYSGGNIAVTNKVIFRLPGDVNGDGLVNTLDATLALQFDVGLAVPTPEEKVGADINTDGLVTVQDIVLILRKAIGL